MKLFFDHILKTAGTSLRTFLEDSFGQGVVSPRLVATKLETALILYKEYKVLWGHFDFIPGQKLPAGYISATLLREPGERTLSHFFYYKQDVFPSQVDSTIRSISVEEAFSDHHILLQFFNLQAVHFAHFFHPNPRHLSENDLLRYAKNGLEQYDLVGTTERIAEFSDELRRIFNLPKHVMLKKINVTSKRPKLSELPHNIQKNIKEITQVDRELWEYAQLLFDTKTKRFQITEKDSSCQPPKEHNILVEGTSVVEDDAIEFLNVTASGRTGRNRWLLSGEEILITISFRCHKDVEDLTIGYSVHHISGLQMFAINTRLMGYTLKCKTGHDCRVMFSFVANLGIGHYYLNVSAHTGLSHFDRCFFQKEKVTFFEVIGHLGISFEGLVRLMPICHLSDGIEAEDTIMQATGFKTIGLNNPPLTKIEGSIRALTQIPPIQPSQQFSIMVEISNDGNDDWFFGNEPIRPVHISYHWLDSNGNVVVWDGRRTFLSGRLAKGDKIRTHAFVEAPTQKGEFILELTLVQEKVCWFEEKGFKTCRLNCRVGDENN